MEISHLKVYHEIFMKLQTILDVMKNSKLYFNDIINKIKTKSFFLHKKHAQPQTFQLGKKECLVKT